jgi:bifunctional non-homologous end joining protein LigD
MPLTFPLQPMRAVLGTLPIDDDGWSYEIKWDGYRTLAFVEDGRTRLQSTTLLDVSGRWSEIGELATGVHATRAVLDGELVVLDDAGRPRFELIQRHQRQAVYFIFDVLSVGDHDTIGLPYEERRRLLNELVEPGSNWTVPGHHIGDGASLLAATAAQELEGVMAKRLGSTYVPGARTPNWRKVKNRIKVEVVIGGFTSGTGNRQATFGALLVGRPAGDGSLAFAGGVGTGFNQKMLESLHARLLDLRTDECPFEPRPPREYIRTATWVEPVLRAELEITEFTSEGFVRQASFIRLLT